MSLKDIVSIAIKDSGTKIEFSVLMAFIAVESGGRGFDEKTGKLLIQFEPHWFKKKAPYAPSGNWSVNKVDRQEAEYKAFSEAFRIDSIAAMESTSIGLPQIMGFHWERLGYSSVGAMWDDFKKSETHQVKALIKFIETDKRLMKAILEKDWHMVAMIYNGAGYARLALKYGREPYNLSMQREYEKWASLAK